MEVESLNAFGNPLEHFPLSSLQRASHGPCSITLVTILYRASSSTGSGMSALMRQSITSAVLILSCGSRKTKQCICGSPRFWNSIVCTCQGTYIYLLYLLDIQFTVVYLCVTLGV